MKTNTEQFWAGHQSNAGRDAISRAFNHGLHDLIRAHAPKPMAKIGERVWTRWNPRWVKDHECVIYQINAVLCDNNFGCGPDDRDCGERINSMGWMGVRLEYYAHKLDAAGNPTKCGMVLDAFRKANGSEWRQWPGRSFNHCGLSVTIAGEES